MIEVKRHWVLGLIPAWAWGDIWRGQRGRQEVLRVMPGNQLGRLLKMSAEEACGIYPRRKP